jgi:hypothetical protein
MPRLSRVPALSSIGLVVAIGLLAAAPAWAHVPPSTASTIVALVDQPLLVAGTPPSPPAWLAGIALALAAGALAAGRRRGLRVGLVLLLVVFLLEAGTHSVHHLADQGGAAQCAVAMASAQVHGATADCPTDAVSRPVVVARIVLAETTRPGAAPLRPDEGRAPPA